MMKILQRLGKSMMLPVACLPIAAILMGIGYWIDESVMINPAEAKVIALFLVKAGGAIIDNMGILFALGVAIGMSDDGEGTVALAALVSWLMVTTLLSPGTVALFQKIDASAVNPAFGKIQNQFIGIVCGLIGAFCYNRFKGTKLPDALSFFSGKRCVAIVTGGVTVLVSLILFFVWPALYSALISFGEAIIGAGAVGAGIYAFLNRLLIPFGLHHALNAVFWFDIAGINDLGKFWGTMGGGVYGQTGMYMTGFFPVMMFGLPAAALAMYHCAKKEKKSVTKGMLGSSALSSFFTGITEPLEFSFMFLAPVLYVIHAVMTGIIAAILASLPIRSGFNFSAGVLDLFFSFKAPMAQNPWMLFPIGIAVGIIYYIVFRFAITKFNLKTPGREDDDEAVADKSAILASDDYDNLAVIILEGLGGKNNIAGFDNCITRLRVETKDYTLVNEKKIRSAGVAGVMRPGKTAVQIIIGTKSQFVADAVRKLLK